MVRKPINELRLGARFRSNQRQFLECLRKNFFRNVLDPADYLEKGFYRSNLCLCANIVCMIYHKTGVGINKITMAEMSGLVDCLQWQSFVDLEHLGIQFKQLSAYEKSLSPIPQGIKNKFPSMGCFQGFSINVFEIRREGDIFRLFPISLSKNHKDGNFFQIDLLLDKGIREESHIEPPTQHLLLIRNLSRLFLRFTGKYQNFDKYQHLCKSCFYVTTSRKLLEDHYTICDGISRNWLGRRRSLNVLLHRTHYVNKFTGRTEPYGLTFRPGDSYMTLRNLSFVSLDFESFNKNPRDVVHGSAFENVPTGTEYVQTPMSWAYCHKSLYKNHPLPDCLKTPRFRRIDESDPFQAEKEFFLSLLLSLRKDLLLHSQYLTSVFEKDKGPPKPDDRSVDDIIKMMNQTRCLLCSRRFGSIVTIERRGPTGGKIVTKYRVKRCFDHDHAGDEGSHTFPFSGPKLRAVLCQVLNIT